MDFWDERIKEFEQIHEIRCKEQPEKHKDEIFLEILTKIQERAKNKTVQELGITREELEQVIEENKKKWQEFASNLYKQRIEDLTKEIERLKVENEAVKRELRVKDMKEVLRYYEKAETETQKEAMQEQYNLGQSIESARLQGYNGICKRE